MSERDNCRLLAFDPDQLLRITNALGNAAQLARELALIPVDPEVNSAHIKNVIEAQKLEGPSRCLVMLKAPWNWASEIAEYMTDHHEGDWSPQLLGAIARAELWCFGAAEALVYFSPRFRAEFIKPEEEPAGLTPQPCIVDAFGGEPDVTQDDLVEALSSAVHSPERVRELSAVLDAAMASMGELPAFQTLTGEAYEAEMELARLRADETGEFPKPSPAALFTQMGFDATGCRELLEQVASLYRKAAAASWSVSVGWGYAP